MVIAKDIGEISTNPAGNISDGERKQIEDGKLTPRPIFQYDPELKSATQVLIYGGNKDRKGNPDSLPLRAPLYPQDWNISVEAPGGNRAHYSRNITKLQEQIAKKSLEKNKIPMKGEPIFVVFIPPDQAKKLPNVVKAESIKERVQKGQY